MAYTTDRMHPDLPRPDESAHNKDMETRISKLEVAVERIDGRLHGIETNLAVVKSNYATTLDIASVRTEISGIRTEIANAKNSIILWVVGAVFFAQILPAMPGIFRAFGWIQ